MTTTELFARAIGKPLNPGPHVCFWCGASCDESHAVTVTGTFWDWDVVASPRSPWQCVGCTEALDSKREMAGREKLQRTWTYSWLITESAAVPWTKSHIDRMRAACLNPPPPPWSLAIAESGQKHLLFRTPLNVQAEPPYRVQLELTPVEYAPDALAERLVLCGKIAAAVGKPVLSGPLDFNGAIRFAEYHGPGSVSEGELWAAVWNEPVSRLAAFLSLSKDEAQREYPSSVPDPQAGPPGVRVATGGHRGRGGQRGLFAE